MSSSWLSGAKIDQRQGIRAYSVASMK